MNSLTQTRQDVVDVLTAAGLNAFTTIPDRATPPLVGVSHDNPYVEDGPTMNAYTVHLAIRIVGQPGSADVAAEAIDAMVCQVITALAPDQWSITVNGPGVMTVGNAEMPAVDISIANEIMIEGGA